MYMFSDDRLTCTNAVRKPTSKKFLPLDGPCQPYSGGTSSAPALKPIG